MKKLMYFIFLILTVACTPEPLPTPSSSEAEENQPSEACDNYLDEEICVLHYIAEAYERHWQQEVFYVELVGCELDTVYGGSLAHKHTARPLNEEPFKNVGFRIFSLYEEQIGSNYARKYEFSLGGFGYQPATYSVVNPFDETPIFGETIAGSGYHAYPINLGNIRDFYRAAVDLGDNYLTIDVVDTLGCNCIQGSFDIWLREYDAPNDIPVEEARVIHIWDDFFCVEIREEFNDDPWEWWCQF